MPDSIPMDSLSFESNVYTNLVILYFSSHSVRDTVKSDFIYTSFYRINCFFFIAYLTLWKIHSHEKCIFDLRRSETLHEMTDSYDAIDTGKYDYHYSWEKFFNSDFKIYLRN